MITTCCECLFSPDGEIIDLSFLLFRSNSPCVCIQWAKSNSLWTCWNVSFSSLTALMSSVEKNFNAHDEFMSFEWRSMISQLRSLRHSSCSSTMCWCFARQMKRNWSEADSITILNLISLFISVDRKEMRRVEQFRAGTYSHCSLAWNDVRRRDSTKMIIMVVVVVSKRIRRGEDLFVKQSLVWMRQSKKNKRTKIKNEEKIGLWIFS